MSTLEITSESDAAPVPEEAAEAQQPAEPVETAADTVAPTEEPPAPVAAPVELMPHDRLERVEAWGMNTAVVSYVYRPTTLDGIYAVFDVARKHKRTVGLRGAGRSYGDASLSAENICLDLTRMNRILDWDPQSGIIAIEPGVTLRQLWQYIIEDGWWPPVVSGTMTVTMGGALGMNYHGKNNYKMGPIGDHTLEFDLMLPSGEVKTCSRTQNADIFFAAIGGFGMLGVFTRIVLQMKHVESGLLSVDAFSTQSFADIIREFEARMDKADYLVGWIDCFARGAKLGRGQVHAAYYLHAEEDKNPAQSLRVENQELPDSLFGIIPKSLMWRMMKPISNDFGMRLLNAAKFFASNTIGNHKTVRQSHAGFAFLLDYVPNWKFVYKPGGLIQYQSFVPAATADACFTEQIALCQQWGIVPYLGVFKRHRPDEFLMSHAVEGYSLALDFPVTARNRKRLWEMTVHLNQLVLNAGGRFYFAKDSTLDPQSTAAYLGDETLRKFFLLKHACDPEHLLQTDLSRRLFGSYDE